MELAVEVTDLTKTYKLYSSPLERALDALRKEETAERFTALDNVSAEFPKGEVIAILGKNGSGKSTLLKIITGVTTATEGAVRVNGRVSAMLELTSGFDQELTGTENIYLRALAMGIPKEEIAEKEAEIIDFADIGDHIDQPVRTYSSGMKARLGFAVLASVDPDILIIDEVLAVGDEVFRLKCIERMEEFRKQGKTILFVSHALFTVKAFCTKGLWLNEGKVMAAGEIGEVIPEYENFLRQERARQKKSDRAANSHSDKPLGKSDLIETKNFRMLDEDGGKTTEFKFGEDILFEFEYLVKQPMDRLTFCYTVRNAEHLEVYMADKQNEANVISSSTGLHSMRVRLKEPRLLPGDYLLSGEIWNNDAGLFVGYANKRPFKITQTKYLGTGIVHIDYEFGNDE